jgi:signal transduction histidine kinase
VVGRAPTPWTDSWFWLLQVVILAVALVRLAVTVGLGLDAEDPGLEFSTIFLFLPLTMTAAWAFGTAGALVSCAWVTLLDAPRLADVGATPSVVAAEVVQIAVLALVSIVTGVVVDRERRGRVRAEGSLGDAAQAVAVYRELFDTNRSPILVVDGDGTVVQANPAARAAFELVEATASGEVTRRRLVDVVGAEAARDLLGSLLDSSGRSTSADGPASTGDGRGGEVQIPVGGRSTLFRPTTSMLVDGRDRPRMQVAFHDVTEERRERELLEAFAGHVVRGQEDERKRISQELHDGPLQNLIHLCRQLDDVVVEDDRSVADGLRASVESVVAEIRGIARGLRPSALDDLGLVASVSQLLTELEARSGLVTSYGVTGSVRRVPPDVELALFRIVQEALSNTERHAQARSVAVGLDFEQAGLRLLVRDDGLGFESGPSRRPSAASLGIEGMVERANLIGATLRIRAAPGAGTSIDVVVPAASLA